jgi:crotonobetainyl-CoA:carnitine CoA-transferase CaiB-like acyl-CoA transferase
LITILAPYSVGGRPRARLDVRGTARRSDRAGRSSQLSAKEPVIDKLNGLPGPLTGLRVIDFGQYVAGPLTAVLLADQGADVIHVDPPGGPRRPGVADAFFNRGKRRAILDLKKPGELAAARRLTASADVVIENFRPGVLARLGLDLDAIRRVSPALITCSLPGFGADDPRAAMRGYEGVIAAATANCQPRAGEEPPGWDWERPTHSALPLASSFAAYLAATSIVMALIARRRTGRGQRVEVPLFDAMFTLIGHSGAYADKSGPRPPRPIHGRGAGAFRCRDGRYVQFDTSSARHLSWFARAAGLLGRFDTELLDLAGNATPEVNERLHARLREEFLTRSAAEWEELGNTAGAAIGFIRTPAEWIGTEQARRSHAVTRVTDPELGAVWCAGVPVLLSEFPDPRPRPRRLAGADTAAVLAELAQAPRQAGPAGGDPGTALPAPEPGLAQPLSGIRVLDLGLALSGPTCGRILAEFGADVVKIGRPAMDSTGSSTARGAGYLNRGKKSLLLDLGALAGQEVYWRLVDRADVVLENFSPGTAGRLAIAYEQVRARRPEAVYTSISCYGPGGPWTHWRGWERQGQAVTGIMERTELPSVLGPYNIVDIGTGILGAFATALALYHRFSTGRGQLACASLAQTATYHQAAFMFDFPGYRPAEPRGYLALGESPLQRYYRAADKWFFLAARPEDVAALAAVTGAPDVATSAGAALAQALGAAFATASAADQVARLAGAGIAAHAVVPVAELMTDAVVRDRGLSVTQEVAGAGNCTMPGVSARLSDTPALVGDPPHRPGEDARQVLASVGLAGRLGALERGWVVRSAGLPAAWP